MSMNWKHKEALSFEQATYLILSADRHSKRIENFNELGGWNGRNPKSARHIYKEMRKSGLCASCAYVIAVATLPSNEVSN